MKVERLATDGLIPYARNAKKHDDAQVAQIAASIREFGFNSPVLIDQDNGIIACENLKRRCRAIEISPAYVAVALERWHQHTGQTPVLMA